MHWKAAPQRKTAYDMMTPRQRRIALLKLKIATAGPREIAELQEQLVLEEKLEAV